VKVFEEVDWTEQRAATTGPVLVRMLAWCGASEREEEVFVSP
jgi:hypothetical protein